MEIKKIISPRFEVIANYPDCDKHKIFVGSIVTFEYFDKELNQWLNDNGKQKIYDAYYESYPHLFKKLNWWENREESEMPKYLKHRMDITTEDWTYDIIESWNMKTLVGWLNEKERTCCSLLSWNPKYGYFPATKEDYENYVANL